MRLHFLWPALAMLIACSPPVMFRVEVDEPANGGTMTLNGNSADLMTNIDGALWARWESSDASGEILIRYPDGDTTTCQIGYVTHGLHEIQQFRVVDRDCEQVAG